MRKIALHLPINSVSFGQISLLILRRLFELEKAGKQTVDWSLLPIAQVDLSSQKVSDEFKMWLQMKIAKTYETYHRDIPVFKLWHLNGSLESFARKQTLFTFYELDFPTKIELNIAKNNKVCFSNQYTHDVFKLFGQKSSVIPLAFDDYNFKILNKKFHNDGRIVFNVCGKLEKRKHHGKIISLWIKKFGGNPKYALQCATFNPHLNEQQNNELIAQIVGMNKPFNVSFYPRMVDNEIYNEFLNSAQIIIGMSGGEGWGLPEFHSVALGKQAIILDAHGYKAWANNSNSIMVKSNGKIPVFDNIFFRQGDAFNQGNIFDWNEDEFIHACEEAIKKVESDPVNKEGLKLQEEFTKDRLIDNIIKETDE